MTKDLNILIGGAAGQGIQTIGALLAQVCHNAGLFIFSVDDFESRIRGGHNYHLLRISDQPLSAPRMTPHIIVAIDDNTVEYHRAALAQGGMIFHNSESDKATEGSILIPLKRIAESAGGIISSNTVAAGAVLAAIGAELDDLNRVLVDEFKAKGPKILEFNLKAAAGGYEFGKAYKFSRAFDFSPKDHENSVLSGSKAAALGALAADCRFFPFYPMSPGTGIVTNAAAFADRLPLVVEQAEDEIAAVNMAIGASFAGVRSLVATSGGGFCLMTEGLGLSAMTETPIVIVDAQRPGPATGLATRTAQADLMFAIYASQDEFPRFVFAPGSPLEVFNTTKKAFRLSEKYQVPAIILLDQFIADSARTENGKPETGYEHETFLQRDTQSSRQDTYMRYELTHTGISPRRIPCDTDFLVRAPGNEHTPAGLSTEDPSMRNQMVEKRFRKLPAMKQEMRMPAIFCNDSQFYLTGWGSSKGSIMEACLCLREQGINTGWILFEDIWPLDENKLRSKLLGKKMIMVEGNATSQLGTLIRQLTGLDYFSSILKYDGRPIYPEFIIKKMKQIIGV